MNKKESSLKAFFGKETLKRKIKRLRREKMNKKESSLLEKETSERKDE